MDLAPALAIGAAVAGMAIMLVVAGLLAYYLERKRRVSVCVLCPLHFGFHGVCHVDDVGVLVCVDLYAKARLAIGAGDCSAAYVAQFDCGYIFQPY